jgi:hypothetical protein
MRGSKAADSAAGNFIDRSAFSEAWLHAKRQAHVSWSKPMLNVLISLLAVATANSSAQAADRNDDEIVVSSRERMVCRNEARTNTRFARRTCVSSRKREEQSEEHRRAAGEMIDRPVVCVGVEGC